MDEPLYHAIFNIMRGRFQLIWVSKSEHMLREYESIHNLLNNMLNTTNRTPLQKLFNFPTNRGPLHKFLNFSINRRLLHKFFNFWFILESRLGQSLWLRLFLIIFLFFYYLRNIYEVIICSFIIFTSSMKQLISK